MNTALTRRIAALSASLGLLSSPASAEVTAGVYLSLVYERVGTQWDFALGWGAEAAANQPFDSTDEVGCVQSKQLAGFGPVLRLGFVGWGDARVSLGALLTRRSEAALTQMQSIEAAVAMQVARVTQPRMSEPLLNPVIGLRAAFGDFEANARWTFVLDEAEAGVMILSDPRLGVSEASCVIGRPIRDEAGDAVAVLPDANAPDAVIARWRQMALMERASVPAFLQLSQELLALGAPVRLVRRALRSARDEQVHTRLCAQMANRLADDQWAPAPTSSGATRPVARGRAALTRLAVESWIDGCLGEGRAAAEAGRAARAARDPWAQRVNARIAVDEGRHAELGWAVLSWALARGGRPVVDAVRAARDAAPGVDRLVPVGRHDSAWGVLSADERRAIGERSNCGARARLDRVLAAVA